jgi:hypothetical protein
MRLPHRDSSLAKGLVAVIFHRPGLWFWYRVEVNEGVRGWNKIALGLVVVAMVAAALSAPKGFRLPATLAVWLVGHLVWGIYLAIVVTDDECQTLEQHLLKERDN